MLSPPLLLPLPSPTWGGAGCACGQTIRYTPGAAILPGVTRHLAHLAASGAPAPLPGLARAATVTQPHPAVFVVDGLLAPAEIAALNAIHNMVRARV